MPGTRADMIAKIPRFAPDVAAVDLEDAVAPGAKDSARRTAADAIDALGTDCASTVLLRVNLVGSPWFAATSPPPRPVPRPASRRPSWPPGTRPARSARRSRRIPGPVR